jgi:hypothetical protein
LDISGATFEDDRLVIGFGKQNGRKAEPQKKRASKKAPRADGAPKEARGGR